MIQCSSRSRCWVSWSKSAGNGETRVRAHDLDENPIDDEPLTTRMPRNVNGANALSARQTNLNTFCRGSSGKCISAPSTSVVRIGRRRLVRARRVTPLYIDADATRTALSTLSHWIHFKKRCYQQNRPSLAWFMWTPAKLCLIRQRRNTLYTPPTFRFQASISRTKRLLQYNWILFKDGQMRFSGVIQNSLYGATSETWRF